MGFTLGENPILSQDTRGCSWNIDGQDVLQSLQPLQKVLKALNLSAWNNLNLRQNLLKMASNLVTESPMLKWNQSGTLEPGRRRESYNVIFTTPTAPKLDWVKPWVLFFHLKKRPTPDKDSWQVEAPQCEEQGLKLHLVKSPAASAWRNNL